MTSGDPKAAPFNAAPTTSCRSPILLLLFNRPETTRKVLQKVRLVAPRHLYISADGPRSGRSDDTENCALVRELVTEIDWNCEVRTRFLPTNAGSPIASRTAIDWFFESVEEGIVLEDDCVPDTTFFHFADELLERYRENEEVMTICAQGLPSTASTQKTSYVFSHYPLCWGWASWRRAWRRYEPGCRSWRTRRDSSWLRNMGDGSLAFQWYWTGILDDLYSGKRASWDYTWMYSCWSNGGLSIVPTRNLVSNIGFGPGAAHTTNPKDPRASQQTQPMQFPMIHPPSIHRSEFADKLLRTRFFGITRTRLLVAQIKKHRLGRQCIESLKTIGKRLGLK